MRPRFPRRIRSDPDPTPQRSHAVRQMKLYRCENGLSLDYSPRGISDTTRNKRPPRIFTGKEYYGERYLPEEEVGTALGDRIPRILHVDEITFQARLVPEIFRR
jgi:hypothetical protein